MSWRQQLEPYATVWKEFAEHVQGRGLMHGRWVVDRLQELQYGITGCSPADGGDLIRDMVEAGVIVPCQKDIAGSDASGIAWRSIMSNGGPDGKGQPSGEWCSSDAVLWTYVSIPKP
jgi:hypothetical protein